MTRSEKLYIFKEISYPQQNVYKNWPYVILVDQLDYLDQAIKRLQSDLIMHVVFIVEAGNHRRQNCGRKLLNLLILIRYVSEASDAKLSHFNTRVNKLSQQTIQQALD